MTGGGVYALLGLAAGAATALVSGAPPVLVQAVAGLALLGALLSGLQAALEQAEHRTAAVVVVLVVASGVSAAGVGSAVWGLLAGGACYAWLRPRRPRPAPPRGG